MSLLQKSYWYKQWEQTQKLVQKDIEKICNQISACKLTDIERGELDQKKSIEETIRSTQNAKKRDAQRALEKWKDSHLGPKWFLAEKQYSDWVKLVAEKNSAERLLAANEKDYLVAIDKRLQFLVDAGFLEADKETLTNRGTAATEFNEGQPILCTELAFRNTLGSLSVNDFITCIACFITESDKGDSPTINSLNVSTTVKNALMDIGSLATMFGSKEYDLTRTDTNFWDLSTTWIEPVADWLEGKEVSIICSTYGTFEGNFVRTILRLANLVDEWVAVATFIEDVDLLEKLKDIRTTLVRDILVPDSLYLHL
jgi:superfamily II RNA helicase